ncbi:MAG TPA: glycosyltransferase [Acidimicrobiia bacterium]|jgi:glycosyltransferase involved in cell wall biosynthesis|nr:glycosyltransferase [Acidimicrobiia bacterium]
MRILFVVQRYGTNIAGGSEQCCRLFAEHLSSAGHQVEVATSCAKNYTDWSNEFQAGSERINDVLVHRFPVDRKRDGQRFSGIDAAVVWGTHPVPLSAQELWVNEMGPRTTGLPKWLASDSSNYDIVIFFTYLYYTTIRGLPAVAGRTPTLFQPTAHLEPHLLVPIFDRLFRLPDGIAFLTVEEASLVNQRFGHSAVEEVIGVGTDLSLSGDGNRFRSRHQIGNNPFLLYVGRVDPGKGSLEAFDYFVAYKKRNPSSLKLVIVGEQVMHLPNHPDLITTGFVPEQEKLDALAACTAFLQPSYFESFSMALTEAWSMGKPALVQGRCEVLVGQTRRSGGGFPYQGFAEFEAALDLLLEDPHLNSQLGENGRLFVANHYQWEDLIMRYEDLLLRTIEAFNRRPYRHLSTGR